MTAAEQKFRAEQNNVAKDRLHADMAALTAGDQPAVKKPIADPKRFGDAEFVRTVRHYTLRTNETIADVKAPGFFKFLAARFNLGDILEVRSADLTFWSQLMVVGSDHIAADVELRTLIEVELAPVGSREFAADGYRIEDTKDVLRRLAVIRTADGKLMRDGFKNRQEAQHYISTELVARAA